MTPSSIGDLLSVRRQVEIVIARRPKADAAIQGT